MSLEIEHHFGFFSCSSMILHKIIEYYNNTKKLPDNLITKNCYTTYKNIYNTDITYFYFKHYNGISDNIIYNQDIDFKHWYEYKNYTSLDFEGIIPFIKKYFTPTDNILNIIKNIENKYNLDYDNICVLFFKGKNKYNNVELPSHDEYIKYAKHVLSINPDIKFLIKSDETNFILEMAKEFTNNIIFDNDIQENNFEYSLKYLAITIIMSKCKYIICNSCNRSMWIFFYRGNTENVIQFRACTTI